MRHAWILDVLTDLRTYAAANDLPAIAAAAAQSLEVAEAECAIAREIDDDRVPDEMIVPD
jgi:hypothetical protein